VAEKATDDEKIIDLMSDPATLERGFRLLMAEHQERLYWHVRRMVGTHADADDVLQNTFVKAWRGFGNFEAKSKIYTWLYRIATNESITFLNQKKRQANASLDDPASFTAMRLAADTFFDGDAAQMHLQKAIAVLPEKQKQVFNLRYFEEMPYEEMSELLGTSVGALKASFHHAVKKVEAFFGNIEFA
jgi:RNA polymerase sigma factor (sigma-70 family)